MKYLLMLFTALTITLSPTNPVQANQIVRTAPSIDIEGLETCWDLCGQVYDWLVQPCHEMETVGPERDACFANADAFLEACTDACGDTFIPATNPTRRPGL